MSDKSRNAKLAVVKSAMAERYERLAKVCGSRNRRQKYLHHAITYREQSRQLSMQS